MIHLSQQHKAITFPFRADVANLFPHAKQFNFRGAPYLALPHGLDETRTLRNLGLDVPAPILTHYDWAGGKPFEVQCKTAAMLTTSPRAYVLNSMGCVDADTEYLSERGWQRIADYQQGKVAQYNPADQTIEFVTPTQFVKLPCAEMIRFKTTRDIDQLLSPEHRVLLANGSVVSAADVEATYGTSHSQWVHKFRTTFKVLHDTELPLSDDQIRLQVAVNADGYQRLDWEKVTVRLKRTRKIERLRALLHNANVKYNERPCKPTGFVQFTFVSPTVKGFDSTWWKASQHQLEVIADEATHWDGSFRKASGCSFTSYDKYDADFVQFAYSASGRRTSLSARHRAQRGRASTEYQVHARAGKPTAGLYGVNAGVIRKNVWREPTPDGFKYCFMVPSTFLLLRRNGCIFATGNTGKTKAALWAWDYLYGLGAAGKLMVVAPLSTLNVTWLREIFDTIHHRKAIVLHGTKAQRSARLADDTVDIFIINHDGIGVVIEELKKRSDINALILDELAVYRNGQARRTKQIRDYAKSMKWVWGMTGSPTPNEPTDAWSQASIVTPHTVPKYFTRFRDELMSKAGPFKFVPKHDAIDKAYAALQPAVRYTLDDIMELPELIERQVDIELGEKQAKVYKTMKANAYAAIQSQEITAMNAGAVLNKLLQISAGWVYTSAGKTVALDNEKRLDALVDALNASQNKVIVFAPFVHALDGIAKRLKDEGFDYETVSGATAKAARDEIFRKFQNTSSIRVLVAHPQCMAHGLTLTSADTIIWFAPTTSLEIFEQANARIRRVGQKHKQLVLMFQSTDAEKRMYTRLRAKQKVQNTLLDMFAENS